MIKDILNSNESMKPNTREIEVLREHFPACFKSDGSFDLERFKEYLNDKVTVKNEGYELKFLGKNYARLLASVDSTTVIVPDEEHNNKPENKNSENIYISGDNLDGLKHLLKSYAGQVKCIYIDPPYNTGSDGFVYNDNFNFTVDELAEKLSIDDEQAQRILDLTKRGSASHSAWLMFMYPRLLLARDLLTDDGVIFISIDDNEQANCKLICDDVFGEENFAGQISVVNNMKGRNDRANIATTHEYLLMYVNFKFISGGIPLTEEQRRQYKYVDENGNSYALRDLRKRGRPDRREDRPNMYFPIYYNPEAKECSMKKFNGAIKIVPLRGDGTDGRWRWGKEHVARSLNILHPEINRNGKWVIKHRVYLNPTLNPIIEDDEFDEFDDEERTSKAKSFWQGGELSTDVARRTLKSILPEAEFDYPKSVELIKRILHLGAKNDCIICDFFGGSGTTMQAAVEFNLENERNLKTIIIQLPEELDQKLQKLTGEEKTKTEKVIDFLDEIKKPHTLDQIGMERIKRAAAKLKEEHPDTTTDLGFKHYTLQEISKVTLDKLEDFVPDKIFLDNYILSDFGVPTVLTTWLVRDGYGFTAPVQKLAFADYNAYYMDKHLYLLDAEISKEAIAAIADKFETDGRFNPENIVIFGYSFTWTALEELKVNLARLKATEKNLHLNFDVRY